MLIFENLEVYKKAFSINQKIYRFLKHNTTIVRYMRDQLGRASLSIQLNIAEGSGRFAKKDRRNFFVMARSSALECASIIEFLVAEEEMPTEFHLELRNGFEEISKMLFTMIKNLEE
ncbi:MAG: four helix bundle protein [Flavipsychrobacter sp.]|nr:four helix bundle protein [Flavipsychrobacter sp.]